MEKELPRGSLAFGWHATKQCWPWAVLAVCAVIAGSSVDTAMNIILKNLIDSLSSVVTTNGMPDFRGTWLWVILYSLGLAVAGTCWRTSGFAGMQWVTKMKEYTYSTLFNYLTHHSAGYFSDRFAGALTNNVANAAEGVSHVLENILWQFLPLFITFFAGLYVVSTAHRVFSVILFTWFVPFLLINIVLVRSKRARSVAYANATSRMRGVMVDSATNILAVHQSGHQEEEIKHIDSFIRQYRKANVRNWIFSEFILITSNVLQILLFATVLTYAVLLLGRGLVTVGDIVMIIGFTVQLTRQVFFIGGEMNRLMDDYGQASEGLKEILMPHGIVDRKKAMGLSVQKASIVFKNVEFSYGKQQVFRKLNLSIASGQKVGLVGYSGAGKTSLTSILLRQYDIQGGDVLIDRYSIKNVTQKSIRQHIAIVPQEPSLFHRSIRDNIRYGTLNASDDDVRRAAALAQASDFISVLPKKYDTLVGERGVKLSGGQRQRIAIARAILKHAPILVLDEATSALDSESEAAIQKALKELMKGKTVLAIAHRLSTLRAMDRIIVLDKGLIIEDGTHAELLVKKGLYAQLWASQVSGFIQE